MQWKVSIVILLATSVSTSSSATNPVQLLLLFFVHSFLEMVREEYCGVQYDWSCSIDRTEINEIVGSSTMALLFLWMLFKKLGPTYVLSEKLLQHWKSSVGMNRVARKFIAAVKPLRAHVGSIYWVRKATIMEILQIIISMTINWFLAS